MAKQLNAVLIFGGDASKALAAVNSLNDTVNRLNTTVTNMGKKGAAASRTAGQGWTQLTGIFQRLQLGIKNVVDGFRLMTQGLMSAGRAFTFFVTIPLAMFLRQAAGGVTSFQDGLIRVSKTTGNVGKDLETVSRGLRDVALSAPTATNELLAMAEQAGMLGISKPDKIIEFVRWMEIMATSTNIAGDEVVSVMGKISAAFGWNINESVSQTIRLANVMNVLENQTAATAGEIADALFRFAPVANQLGIHAADAAALSAALISLGVSADSSGTRLGTMYIKMTQNADKFAELASNTEAYAEEQDVLNAINEDAVSVLMDLIDMMAAEDNRAKALAESFELVGIRGGRALGALASGEDTLRQALIDARMEWGEASSLIEEYNRQLESASSQMQILRNNVNDVALSFGTSLLPAVNNLIQLLIPGIRKLSAWFEKLDNTTKLWIVAGLAVAVALGPVMFMLSQVTFGVTMFLLGILKLISGMGALVTATGGVISALAAMNWWVIGLVGAVVAGMVILLKALQNAGIDIAGFFIQLGNTAVAWGENLAAQIANGFIAGAIRYIVAAIQWVANLIASFFEGHSPPKVGPLSHIGRWGKTLIDAYFEGMKKADFNILKDVSRTIGNIFKNLAATKLMGEKAQYKNLMQARQDLSKLLVIFRETGEISNSVLNDVVKNLGNAADEVKELIIAELELAKINERIAALEAEREQVQEDYAKQIEDIATGPGSPAERVKQIREAMRLRNDEIKRIAKEQREAEKQKTQAEERLELQKAMIEAMQEQDDIQAKMIETLKKLAGALGDVAAGGGFPEIEPGAGMKGIPDIDDILEEIGTPIIELEARIKSKEGIWDAFLMGLRGEMIGGDLQELFGVSDEDVPLLAKAYEWGLKLHDIIEQIQTTWEKVTNLFSGDVFGAFDIEVPPQAVATWDALTAVWESAKALWAEFQPLLASMAEIFTKNFEAIKNTVTGMLGPSFDKLRDTWNRLTDDGKKLRPVFDKIKEGVGVVLKAFGWLAKMWVKFNLVLAFAVILGVVNAVIAVFTAFVDTLIWIADKFLEFNEIIADSSTTFMEKVKAAFIFVGQFIYAWVVGFALRIIQYFKNLFYELVGGSIIPDGLTAIYNWFVDIFNSILEVIVTWIADMLGRFYEWRDGLVAQWEELKTSIITKVMEIKDSVIAYFTELLTTTAENITTWITERLTAWETFKKDLNTLWETLKSEILQIVIDMLEDMGIQIDTDTGTILQNLITWAGELTAYWLEWGESWISSLAKGIENKIQDVLDQIDSLVEQALDWLDPLLQAIKKILDFIKNPPKMPKLGGGGSSSSDDNKGGGGDSEHAFGAIVTTPRTATIGEIPEAIVPIHRLPELMSEAYVRAMDEDVESGNAPGGGDLHIHIHEGAVRGEGDIDAIVEAIKNALNDDIGMMVRYGG